MRYNLKFLFDFLSNSTLDDQWDNRKVDIIWQRQKIQFGKNNNNDNKTTQEQKPIYSFKIAEMLPYIQIPALPTRTIMILSARGFSQDAPHFYVNQELCTLGRKKKKELQNQVKKIPSAYPKF